MEPRPIQKGRIRRVERNHRQCERTDHMIRIGHAAFGAQRQPSEHQPQSDHGRGRKVPRKADPARPHFVNDSARSSVELICQCACLSLVGIAEQQHA